MARLLTVRNNTTKGIAYYVCKARKEDGIAGCPLPYINIERFDKKFLEVTLDDILVPEAVQGAIDHIASELSGPYEQQAATVLALEADIRKVKDQQDRVMAAYEAGAYTVTDFTKRMEPLRRTEADLETKKERGGTPTRSTGRHHCRAYNDPGIRQTSGGIHQALNAQAA